MIISSWN